MLYQLFWLFLAFSFLGWCLEVAATAVRLGQYRDRGVLHGPLCLVYGITGCLITIALRELSGGWFFLFLFSALYATVVEWIAGHLLEHYSHTRWWDYSDRKRMGLWIFDRTERRMRTKAPQLDLIRPKRTKSTVFAAGCSFYKIFLLFVIGAFLGDITETIFCRITAGYWMSRSSLVWGPFSIVWGLAIALVTQVLYKYKDRSAFWLFGMGTLLGGAYEYLCSVFTEIVFGAVFWDYSALPFNLGGRINLLYCFFWGLAAVAWFKVLFPPLDRLIESLPRRGGTILTWCLVVFMAVNMIVSSAALIRYDARLEGVAAQTSLDTLLDEHFDDSYMQRVYPKLVHMN